MKKNRCFKVISLILTMVMTVSALTLTAAAEEPVASEGTPLFLLMQTAELDSTFVQSAVITDQNGTEVTDLRDADPNRSFTLKLSVGERADSDRAEEKLPEDTDTVRMYYVLNNMKAEDGSNGDVAWSYDEQAGQLVFRWVSGRKSAFSAEISVIPNVPAQNDLSGSYLLVTRNRKSIVDEKPWPSGSGRINALAYTEKNGKIFLESPTVPVWVLTHVSGDYYTIHSRRTGAYIRIDGNNATLENTDEASAQKLLVKASGDAYFISYNGSGLNNYNLRTDDGFGAWKLGNGDNEKFRLVAESSVTDEATKDVSGDWVITFANSRKYILAADGNGAVKSVVYVTNNVNKAIFPGDNISVWTFEHVTRDWYNIRTGAGYLNIGESGLRVSGSAQNILVRFNGSNIFLTSSEDNGTAYTIGCASSGGLTVAKGTKTYNDETRITLRRAGEVAGEQVLLSGSYAIVTESSGAAASAEAGNGQTIKSVPFYRTDAGNVFSTEGTISTWTFTQKDGNWYSVRAENGKYMSITDSGVTLSDAETRVYILKYDGKYRFTNGGIYALNNFGNNSRGGYGAYAQGDGRIQNEWMSLAATVAPETSLLLLDANGGRGGSVPASKEIRQGETVVLPGYDGTKNGKAFIGWSKDANIYQNVAGKNNSYRVVYLPGTAYTAGGTETLYAVYNEKSADANFYIRLDGTIPDEPGDFPNSAYTAQIAVSDTVKTGMWVVDVAAGERIEGNHAANAVAANLKAFPTDEQILEKVPEYNPETMYVHWYVLKYAGTWHVDGVIRKKAGSTIAYSTNLEDGLKDEVKNMPAGFQMDADGKSFIAGEDVEGVVKYPTVDGYEFRGWNTEANGSGAAYSSGEEVKISGNVTLFAQWEKIPTYRAAFELDQVAIDTGTDEYRAGTTVALPEAEQRKNYLFSGWYVNGEKAEEDSFVMPEEDVRIVGAYYGPIYVDIVSDWPEDKAGYLGATINLTAVLRGAEGLDCSLQWQYQGENGWVDVPGATEINLTYQLTEETSGRIWRVVVTDAKPHQD